MISSGKVYLVGAGLGSLDTLTVKAYHLLRQAEIVIYDALIDPQLLQFIPSTCLQIPVGKRGGLPSTPQRTINQLLVAYSLQGKQVIRLKSGDPFIFGRAEPEIEALTQANCDYEVIPGISSSLAAPLFAGIPLTEKDLSRCFVVLSGHQPELLDWEALARIDTLVILMGGRTLMQIIERLHLHGRSLSTPIAIIHQGGRPQQRVWWGTLADIVDQVAGITLSPAVIVIGDVVTLAKMSQTSLPLTGKTILVTRSAEQSSQFTHLLQQQGATVLEMPALEICPPSQWEGLDRSINALKSFDWLILTSANGVEYFFERLRRLGKDSRELAGIKIAVVGKKTAAVLQKQGLTPDYIPPDFVADSLVETFPEPLEKRKILFPRVETGGREVLVQEFRQKGAEIIEVPAYQSICPDAIDPQAWNALQQQQVDVVTFASSKTVQNFEKLLKKALDKEENSEKLLKNLCIASIGPQTSKTCQAVFGRVDLEAKEYTLEGLTEAILMWYADNK